MKKLLLLLLLFVSAGTLCAQIKDCTDRSQKNYSCGDVEETILNRVLQQEYKMDSKFIVKLVTVFKKEEDQERSQEIATLCTKVLNDASFWNALENYDRYQYAVFEENGIKREIAGREIVNCLLNGTPDDNSRPAAVTISLDIALYGLSFKTFFETAVAKEIGDGKIYNKKWFFRSSSIEDIGSNWIHEFSHSKGLKHCYYCNEDRDYSIPYVINRIFVEVAKKYMI